ncbi:translation initiation factor IF-2 [Wolbachia endosymbiont of Pentidionis agamae]|uniref:translation initiation factor IF-2 n=1 Tax=Wolbachia endosymbiont of Pentidionis agamae TaxID=3110435 RepID=UPI002FD31F06
MANDNVNKDKLTLHGLNKIQLKVNSHLDSYLENSGKSNIKIEVKKKRRISSMQNQIDTSDYLTEEEQVVRVNALHHAMLQKSNLGNREKQESDKNISSDIESDAQLPDEILNNKINNIRELKKSKIISVEDKVEKPVKNQLKANKDIFLKHSKLVIEKEFNDQSDLVFRNKPSIRSKKSKSIRVKVSREVIIPDEITVKELSMRMAENSQHIIKMLNMKTQEVYSLESILGANLACEIAVSCGHKVKRISNLDKENSFLNLGNKDALHKTSKPPVVTFMGHVDHGKTSLLDSLRQSNIALKESGGITQHIGAYQIVTASGEKITFIDTPGHEAFTEMRARGANITNIVVIVVAADDGIMQQTIEAINHAKSANVSIIVAINKVDRAKESDIRKIINDLTQYNLIPEELGGDVIVVPVSAKEKINLDKLEEAILLIAELMDLKAVIDCRALGWVIESKVDRMRGISATLIVEEGTLKVGDIVVVGLTYGKIRTMVNYLSEREVFALPSTPIEVTGINSVPSSGDKFVVVESEKQARDIIESRLNIINKQEDKADVALDIFSRSNDNMEELSIILKCDVTGSIEAILTSIDKIGKDQIKLNVLHKAVGGVTDSDISLAEASNAIILTFNVKIDSKMKDLAKRKGIEIHNYSIIYELIDDLKSYLTKMLKPLIKEIHIGSLSVRQVFDVSKTGNIAGCYVNNGSIKRDSMVKLMRNSKLIHEGKIKALRRFKDDVKEVGVNFECGVLLENYNDIKSGDILEVYQLVKEERVL